MPKTDQRGPSADLDAAMAEALAAVERHGHGHAPAAAKPPEPPAAAPDATPGSGAGAAPEAGELEQLRLELEMSQERGRKVYEQLKDEHERLLRTAADLDNYKKRAVKEKEEVQRYGNERLVKELLPILDNLERALAAAPEGDPLASGVALTRRLLEEALARFGVTSFSAKGQPFDPRLHEALMTVATADAAPGTVLEEQHRGFHLHERLIRPAAVVVAAAPAQAPAAGAAEAPKPEP
jgi:molecular chaperone GrpE